MDSKLFKKTFPYICNECNEFSHTLHNFCDKCGGERALRRANSKDYKNQR